MPQYGQHVRKRRRSVYKKSRSIELSHGQLPIQWQCGDIKACTTRDCRGTHTSKVFRLGCNQPSYLSVHCKHTRYCGAGRDGQSHAGFGIGGNSCVVRSSIIYICNVRSGRASPTLEALCNARACVFAFVIRPMQKPKVLFAQGFARKPKTAKGCAQISVVLRDETRRPVTVAAAIERVARPSWNKECRGLRDGHVREHCSQYA